jgi:hypothetical protein
MIKFVKNLKRKVRASKDDVKIFFDKSRVSEDELSIIVLEL